MSEKTLIIMVGNIGSGKSTVCNTLVKEGYCILSRDALRYMMGNGHYIFNPDIEPALKVSFTNIVKCYMEYGISKLVIDETNVNRATRAKYLELSSLFGYEAIAYTLPQLSMKESVDRRMTNPHGQNNRTIWESVWKKFNDIYEAPSESENWKEIIYV